MKNWFRRKRLASAEAVRDFADVVETINVLLAKESAQRDADTQGARVAGGRTGQQFAGSNP
jgi:hypothetical protein